MDYTDVGGKITDCPIVLESWVCSLYSGNSPLQYATSVFSDLP